MYIYIYIRTNMYLNSNMDADMHLYMYMCVANRIIIMIGVLNHSSTYTGGRDTQPTWNK